MSANLQYPKVQFQVQEQLFDTKALVDENNFYNQRQGSPSELTKTITYILGNYKRNFPISLMTTGGENYGNTGTSAELDDVQYTYPVMAKRDKVSVVYSTEYVGGDKPGIAHSMFYITMTDNWIKRFYVIQSELGQQAYVHSDGEPVSGGFRYMCQLDPAGPADFCDLTQLNPGARWAELNTAVAESESRSTESKTVMPGMFKNQMGFQRAGISWAGNTANKMMKINIKMGEGPETSVWMDYIMWQFEERWLAEKEHMYLYSRYNRLADGTVGLKDLLTGKIIPRSSGLLEQITNKGTYSSLTYNTLQNKVGDALFGQSDAGGLDITLMTGTGGKREIHNCLMTAGAQFVAGNGVADKFVTGSGYNLMLGGFFDGFYHIDGYTIKVKHNPMFDVGRIAMVSPLHPKSGLPLESYRMVFLDNREVDGQPNIRHVMQKNRGFIDGVVNGLTPMPRSIQILTGQSGQAASPFLGTVQDKSEYTRMSSGGVQLMRGNACFDLQCTAGQAATYQPV